MCQLHYRKSQRRALVEWAGQIKGWLGVGARGDHQKRAMIRAAKARIAARSRRPGVSGAGDAVRIMRSI